MIGRLAADRERGSITPLIPVLAVVLLILGGLIIDGSRDLNARAEAQAYAEEAARAGATAIDYQSVELQLDEAVAAARVSNYCAVVREANSAITFCGLDGADPYTAATTCDGKSEDIVVNTVVRLTIGTSLLGMVGITDLTSAGHAQARPYEGLNGNSIC